MFHGGAGKSGCRSSLGGAEAFGNVPLCELDGRCRLESREVVRERPRQSRRAALWVGEGSQGSRLARGERHTGERAARPREIARANLSTSAPAAAVSLLGWGGHLGGRPGHAAWCAVPPSARRGTHRRGATRRHGS